MPETLEIIKGYLVTLPDGFECRLGPDLTRAQNYAAAQHAVSIEPLYVKRQVLAAGSE